MRSEQLTGHSRQYFPSRLQRALTIAHSSPLGNLVDGRLGFSLHVITEIPYTRAGQQRGEQGAGSGLAHITVICGGHRRGTRGSGSDRERWQFIRCSRGDTAPERLLINAQESHCARHRNLVIFQTAVRNSLTGEKPGGRNPLPASPLLPSTRFHGF